MSKTDQTTISAEQRTQYNAKLLEHVIDAVISMDMNLVIQSWNKAAVQLYGWTAAQAVGKNLVELLKSEYPKDSRAVAIKVLAEKGQYEGEFVHRHKDGTRITVLSSISILEDDHGEAIGYVAINRDITGLQTAGEALRWWAHVFEHLDWGIVIGGENHTLALPNPAFARMHGWTVEELTGRPIIDVFAPEERAEVGKHIAIAHKEGHHSFEAMHIRKDGTRFPVQINLTAVKDKNGAVLYRAASVFDISDQRIAQKALADSEQRYRHMFESAAVAMFECEVSALKAKIDHLRNDGITDFRYYLSEHPEFVIEAVDLISLKNVNDSSVKLFEAADKMDLVRSFPRIFVPETYEFFGELILVLACDREHFESESVFQTVAGKRIYTYIYASVPPAKSPYENPLVSIVDITERKALETQLRQAQRLDTIGTLAGGIAHDFNNILGPILSYTDMLLEDQEEDSKIRTDLERILRSAYRAKELVQQILLFGRQGERERKPLHIHLVVNDALKLLQATIPATIRLNARVDSNCGIVSADPTQVHQVLLNLCTNAQHAMRETGGTLEVRLRKFVPDDAFNKMNPDLDKNSYVELTVSDTGHGIDQASMERIFEPFFTTKHVGEGTGLGLSVAHGIVVSHGGTMTVESAPGKGTTFRVYLPCVDSDTTEPASAPAALDTGRAPSGSGAVLLVEDRAEVAAMGRTMLERLGYKVTVTTSGTDALEKFCRNPDAFDLVLTDQAMPGMSGTTLAKELLQVCPELPIVLMTGFSDVASPESAKRIGIRGFVRKPMVTRELALVLRNALASDQH